MSGSTDADRAFTVRLSAVGQPPVRDESAPTRAISVLFETEIDE
jgi:hypothetical protein